MTEYRFARQDDLLQVARIHKDRFPTHYLGQFSTALLEAFYRNLLEDGHLFVVAAEEGEVQGFVLGGEWKKISQSLHEFMKKHLIRSLTESAVRPRTWKQSLKKLMSLFGKKETDPKNLDNIESHTLLSIATSRASQGKGIAVGMLALFDREMKKMNHRYYLSVQDTNARAIAFYKKAGFTEAYRCEGEIQMIKTL